MARRNSMIPCTISSSILIEDNLNQGTVNMAEAMLTVFVCHYFELCKLLYAHRKTIVCSTINDEALDNKHFFLSLLSRMFS